MKELRLYKSPWKAAKLLLGCAAFVAIGCWMLTRLDAPQWVAWASIGFFGLGIPVSLFQLFDRRPQIIVNDVGIFDRTTHHEFINWEIIRDVYLAEINRQAFICLVVEEAFEPSRQKGKFRQQLASLSKGLGFQELNISLAFVRIDALRFAQFVQAMRNAAPPEREALVRKAIANL
jgi:hypothetical protein